MANTARDLIKCRISNDPGTTGSFILDTAFTNSLLPSSGDNGLAFKLNITENGVGTEIRRNCTYTHSTTTFGCGGCGVEFHQRGDCQRGAECGGFPDDGTGSGSGCFSERSYRVDG